MDIRAYQEPDEEADFEPGPEIGTQLPALQAKYKGHLVTGIEEFSRGTGTILVEQIFSRTWHPESGLPTRGFRVWPTHPGAIIVNRDGIIVDKLFVENPNLRVYSSKMLDYAKKALELKGLF